MGKLIDETGNRYGMLTVIKREGTEPGGKARWLCQCDCGTKFTTLGSRLRAGQTKSCGCNRGRTLPEGEASFNRVYLVYTQNAKRTGREFNITKTEFKKLTQQLCHYCNCDPVSLEYRSPHNGGYAYNGLDRVDNTKGYTLDNVVTCCIYCNRAKDTKTLSEFREWITKLHQHLILTGW